jgi:hypothetical protein
VASICQDPLCRTATESGPIESRGQPCVFPFTFQGKTHNACTRGKDGNKPFAFDHFATHSQEFDMTAQSVFWCATQREYDPLSHSLSSRMSWGFCNCAATAVGSWRTYDPTKNSNTGKHTSRELDTNTNINQPMNERATQSAATDSTSPATTLQVSDHLRPFPLAQTHTATVCNEITKMPSKSVFIPHTTPLISSLHLQYDVKHFSYQL